MKVTTPRLLAVLAAFGLTATSAFAVPTLQVGAPAGSGDSGTYADYSASSSNPTESDTAIISGSGIYVAGAYGPKTSALGGQYGGGSDWSAFGLPTIFNGKGAVLLVSVPDGQSGTLQIDLGSGWINPFHSSATNSYFPNNHDPVKPSTSDFLFFDIGYFNDLGSVPDFATESGSASGEIKTISFNNSGYDWLHFDVMALATEEKLNKGKQGNPDYYTYMVSMDNNPASHDVTYHSGTTTGGGTTGGGTTTGGTTTGGTTTGGDSTGGFGTGTAGTTTGGTTTGGTTTGGATGGGNDNPGAVPEPTTAALGVLGIGALFAATRRRK